VTLQLNMVAVLVVTTTQTVYPAIVRQVALAGFLSYDWGLPKFMQEAVECTRDLQCKITAIEMKGNRIN
jgi:hypothetical protein